MSLVRPAVYDNGIIRMPQQGDLIANCEVIITNATSASTTLTGANVLSGILARTTVGANYNDGFPTPADLVSALQAYYYVGGGANTPIGVQPNLSFRLRILNMVAFSNGIGGGTGVTTSGTLSIPASSWKDYLFTILNGNPPFVFSGNTTNGSSVISNVTAPGIQNTAVGALVTGTGIPAGTTVTGVGTNTIQLSANATATGATISLTASPTYRVDGLGGGAL